MIRSSVVLPEPEGPSSADQLAVVDLQADVVQGCILPNVLLMCWTSMLMGQTSAVAGSGVTLIEVWIDNGEGRPTGGRILGRKSKHIAISYLGISKSCWTFHSRYVLAASVTRPSKASSDAIANAATTLYSL